MLTDPSQDTDGSPRNRQPPALPLSTTEMASDNPSYWLFKLLVPGILPEETLRPPPYLPLQKNVCLISSVSAGNNT